MSLPLLGVIAALALLGVATPLLLRRRRVSPLWMMLAAISLGIVTALVARRSPLEELTRHELEAAMARWAAAGIRDYQVEVYVRSDRLEDGQFVIDVQDGDVVRATQNDVPTTSTAQAYSIAGLFEILSRELELAQNPSAGFGAPAGYQAYLRVRFNSEHGFPERYRRSVGGTSNGVEISVTAFAAAGTAVTRIE